LKNSYTCTGCIPAPVFEKLAQRLQQGPSLTLEPDVAAALSGQGSSFKEALHATLWFAGVKIGTPKVARENLLAQKTILTTIGTKHLAYSSVLPGEVVTEPIKL
jgi:hypothetical protein